MPSWKKIKEGQNKVAWSFIGVILAIIFFVATLYLAVFYEKKASIQFDIISQANVLEVKEQIGKLSIFFAGENISQKKLNLQIITLKVTNTGQVDILQGQYENTLPWGFKVLNAKLIEVTLLDSNDKDIKEYFHTSIHYPDSVYFDKVIFEKKKYFIIKVLLLHDIKKIPLISPFGKIASCDIELVKSFQEQSNPTLWEEMAKGSFSVHILRFIIYTAVLVILILLIVFGFVIPISKINDYRHQKHRKAIVGRYLLAYPDLETPKDRIYFDAYINYGISPIVDFEELLSQKNKIYDFYTNSEQYHDLLTELRHTSHEGINIPITGYIIASKLKEQNLIKVKDMDATVDEEFKKNLKKFLEYLKSVKKQE